MRPDREIHFGMQWSETYRHPGDKFWLALNRDKMRTQYGGSGLLVTRECRTMEELESEVERLKGDLDAALVEARTELAKL